LQELAANPDDVATYLVYADLLQTRGDPRGELIALQHAGETAAADTLLRRHAKHFFGSLAARPGVLSDVKWHLGFIRSCRFASRSGDEAGLAPLFEQFVDHASTALIRRLTIGALSCEDYRKPLQRLTRHAWQTLHALELGARRIKLGRVEPLVTLGANLTELVIRLPDDQRLELDAAWFPRLRALRIDTRFRRDSLATLFARSWSLDTLHLAGVFPRFADDWTPLLAGEPFPQLRHLTLHGCAPGFAAMIANAPLLGQLETLDVDCNYSDAAMRLLANRERFAALSRLTLRGTRGLSVPIQHDLRVLCANVELIGDR
jgi:uncharacterized protein (TIGR02996 family)